MKVLDLAKWAFAIHTSLTNFVKPSGSGGNRAEQESIERFVSLVLLTALIVPAFILAFIANGHPLVAVALAIAAVVMAASLWLYKMSQSLVLAANLFLIALYALITWETGYFNSLYSPTLIWYAALPVISVLLGSHISGFVWLLIGIVTAFLSILVVGSSENESIHSESAEFLYIFSMATLALSIAVFMLIIDRARARAYNDLRSANAAIKVRAETDELTGLLNRSAFRELLSASHCADAGADFGILLLDLDHFKEVNDANGHDIGDLVLVEVAKRLQVLCQDKAQAVARLGGDEFAVMISLEKSDQLANGLAREALKSIRQPYIIEGRNCVVGVSIGVASSQDALNLSEVLRRADVAMYAAKQNGKNCISTYTASMDATKLKRMVMAASLANAVNANRVEVLYQPVVDSQTRQIVAVEALARWRDDSGESISPEEFISVAEEAGLIDQLGLKVLETACRQAMAWPGMRLAVNISPVQFLSPTLVDDILSILAKTGFPAERLELEVTENILIGREERARAQLALLQQNGISIALDDFGTGYSSIGYLRRYKFDRLKIDKSLVDSVFVDQSAQSIVQAIVLIAQNLSLSLTAEGVETEDQARILHLAGCEHLQGYLFGKPQSAQDISRRVNDDNSSAVHTGTLRA